MQASPTLAESGGHLSVPAPAGATHVAHSTKSAIWPTTRGIRFIASPPWASSPKTSEFVDGTVVATREGVDAAAPTPSRKLTSAESLVVDLALGSGGDPEPVGRIGVDAREVEGRDPDQEEGARTRGGDVLEHAREPRVALDADRHIGRIEGCLRHAGIAHQGADDRCDRAWRATEGVPDDHEPVK